MPGKPKLPDEEIFRLIEVLVGEEGEVPTPGRLIYASRVAHGVEISRVRATRLINRYMQENPQREKEEKRPERLADIPPPRAKRVDIYPTVLPPVLVIADLHIPAHDPEWLELVVRRAHEMDIGRVLIAGDLLDFSHLSKFPKERRWTTEEELADAARLLRWMRMQFDNVHLFPGNHDARLSRRVDGEITVLTLLKWVAEYDSSQNVSVYRHHHVYVGRTWVVAHPRNYSRVPARPAEQLTHKLGRNVAVAHTHKFAMARVNGFWAVEIGTIADPGRLSYAHLELTTFPQMEQGALIIDEAERPIMLHPALM